MLFRSLNIHPVWILSNKLSSRYGYALPFDFIIYDYTLQDCLLFHVFDSVWNLNKIKSNFFSWQMRFWSSCRSCFFRHARFFIVWREIHVHIVPPEEWFLYMNMNKKQRRWIFIVKRSQENRGFFHLLRHSHFWWWTISAKQKSEKIHFFFVRVERANSPERE